MYQYDQTFYDYISKGSRRSAEVIAPLLLSKLKIESVLDVGCGAGAWLAAWKENSVNIIGLDGDYVNKEYLYINESEFKPTDLSKPFNLEQQFSLAQSLEVAEHLPTARSSGFIQDLCRHANFVLFSAAPPGQGGDNHINEQTYSFWGNLFAEQDYYCLDIVRPSIKNNMKVEPWYRYNTFLYVKKTAFDTLPSEIKKYKVNGKPRDISPPFYKIRKALIRLIPIPIATKIAKIKENTAIRLNKN